VVSRFIFVWFFRLVLTLPVALVTLLPEPVSKSGYLQLVLLVWLISWALIPRWLGARAAERWKEGDMFLGSILGALSEGRAMLVFVPIVGSYLAPPPKAEPPADSPSSPTE
jgi:hypothetical protein